MSNYHDIRCMSCEGHPRAGWHWNWGDKNLGEILDALLFILPAMPMLRALDITEFRVGYAESGGNLDSMEFLAAHSDHELAVVDEYGKVLKTRPRKSPG